MVRRAFIVPVIDSVNSPMETFKRAMNLRVARLSDLKRRLYEWRRRVRSRGELMSLSDAELRDIGLSRSEAEVEASKVYWLP